MQYTIDGTYLKIKRIEHFTSLPSPIGLNYNNKCDPPYIIDPTEQNQCILCNNPNSLGDGNNTCIACTDVTRMIIKPAINAVPAACICQPGTLNVNGSCTSCIKVDTTNNYLKKTDAVLASGSGATAIPSAPEKYSCEAVETSSIKYNVGTYDKIVKCPVGFKPDSDALTCIIAPETIKSDAYKDKTTGDTYVPPSGYKWISDGNGGIKIAVSSN